jgi:hypothetical protein
VDKIPNFPIAKPTLEQALNSFKELNDLKLSIKKGKWFSRSYMTGKEYIPRNLKGNKASDYFHWAARMSCDSNNSPSPIRSWYSKKFRKGLEKSIYYKDNPARALALRKYIPSQFRPSAGKALVEFFNSKRWYDPCGGWGDRLLAAQSCGVEYYCREMNPLVIAGYVAQQQLFGGNISFEYKGAEEDCPRENYFDLVFTSPPYWKAEKYHGKEQSYLKYKKFDEWVEKFLLPMLENSWDSLCDNGVMAINACDIYANHTYNEICKPINDFIISKNSEVKLLGYEMGKRVNSKSNKKEVFCEPIIIGVKNESERNS